MKALDYRTHLEATIGQVLAALPGSTVHLNEWKDSALIYTPEGTVIAVDVEGNTSELVGGEWRTGYEA